MLAQAKLYGAAGVVIAMLVFFGLYKYEQVKLEKLEVQYNDVVARTERDTQKINELKATSEHNKQQYDLANTLLLTKLDEIKVLESNILEQKEAHYELVKIFSDHDFAKLIKAKPGLIQSRMRNGTKRVFKQLEDASTRTDDNL